LDVRGSQRVNLPQGLRQRHERRGGGDDMYLYIYIYTYTHIDLEIYIYVRQSIAHTKRHVRTS
jgi:hypothetical protein